MTLTATDKTLPFYYDRWGNEYPHDAAQPLFSRTGAFGILKIGSKILLMHPPSPVAHGRSPSG